MLNIGHIGRRNIRMFRQLGLGKVQRLSGRFDVLGKNFPQVLGFHHIRKSMILSLIDKLWY
jgi:hypothetical protein